MITGKQFNEIYYNEKFIKLTNHTCIHNKLKFKEGLNEDLVPFNPSRECKKGGLYFCNIDDFTDWIEYSDKKMYYMWNVKIPDDAKVVVMENKIKCDKFILSNKRRIC